MPEYLAPGVYVEEVDTGPKPIEGVSTTTSGVVGVTERGPEGVPTLVIGFADFRRQFGGYLDRRLFPPNHWYLPHAVEGFFTNGGKRLYVVRVLPQQAAAATTMLFDRLEGGANTQLLARATAGDTGLLVGSTAGMAAGEWLKIDDGPDTEYVVVDATTGGAFGVLPATFAAAHAVGANATAINPVAAGSNGQLAQPVNPVPATNVVTLAAGHTFTPADVGAVVAIDPGPQVEFNVITVVDVPNNRLTLRLPLARPHPVNMVVEEHPVAGQTTLAAAVARGDAAFAVVNGAAPFVAGALLQFDGAAPTDTEFLTAQALSYAVLVAETPLQFPHAPNTLVDVIAFAVGQAHAIDARAEAGADVIVLDNVTALAPNDILDIGGANRREIVVVRAVDAARNSVTLRYPLGFAHLQGDPAPEVTVANANPNLRLSANGRPLDNALILSGAVNAGDVLRLTGASPDQTEFRIVATTPVGGVLLTRRPGAAAGTLQPLPRLHATDTPLVERGTLLRVQAIDRGAWGGTRATNPADGLEVVAEDEDQPILETTAALSNPGQPITLRSVTGIEPGTVLHVGYQRNPITGEVLGGFRQKVAQVVGNQAQLLPAGLQQQVIAGTAVRTDEFKLTVRLVQVNPLTLREAVIQSEGHRQLSMDPRHSRYVTTVVGPIFRTTATTPRAADGYTKGESRLIRVEDALANPADGTLTAAAQAQAQSTIRRPDLITTVDPATGQILNVPRELDGGTDAMASVAAPAVADTMYVGQDNVDPLQRTGSYALRNIDEISMVAIPGQTSLTVQQALINQCELMKYRFAILDSRRGDGVPEVQQHRGLYDSSYAGLYYPWLDIADPFPDNPRTYSEVLIPASGHTMGVFARSDIERGVHKAPANEVIRGITNLERDLMKEHQDILNPRNINVLRNFRDSNRGLRVWGARTLSSDPDRKYVNVRRLFIFLEKSIDVGTQWVVFEPNSEALWARVTRVISSFLRNVWRDGALMGRTPEEAFYVKADRTTMSQLDLDNGRLIVEIGVAPVKPAEFVIFRIGQWAGGSEVDEG